MEDILNYFNPCNFGKYDANGLPEIFKNCFWVSMYTVSLSFFIGTLLFMSFILSHNDGLLIIGFIYVVAATLIHLFLLFFLIVYACMYQKFAGLILQKASVLLLNIPPAILYIYIIFNNNF